PEPTTRTFTRRVYSRVRRELFREAVASLLVADGQIEGVRVGAPLGRRQDDPEAPELAGLGLGRLDERAADAVPAVALGDDQREQAGGGLVVLQQVLGTHAGDADHLALVLSHEHTRSRLGGEPARPEP